MRHLHAIFFLAVIFMLGCKSGGAGTGPPQVAPPAPQAQAEPPQVVQPGAPGQPSRTVDANKAADLSKVQFTKADVEFMQGMIGHHLQAIEMVELLKTHTGSDDMKKLGLRIELSQVDEIKMMRDWLAARGQNVPGEHAHHTGMLMPGMLSPEEMTQLAAAKAVEFDRLFLAGMIKHHNGALIMVDELFAKPGAAQDSDIYAFASDVVADQRMEMDRMAVMLKELQK